jgi:hypothetical protein
MMFLNIKIQSIQEKKKIMIDLFDPKEPIHEL